MTEVILPFESIGRWWHDKKGQKGVMLSDEVVEWLHNYSSVNRFNREWLFGPDRSKWMVRCQFTNSDVATLFKLTFGGQ